MPLKASKRLPGACATTRDFVNLVPFQPLQATISPTRTPPLT